MVIRCRAADRSKFKNIYLMPLIYHGVQVAASVHVWICVNSDTPCVMMAPWNKEGVVCYSNMVVLSVNWSSATLWLFQQWTPGILHLYLTVDHPPPLALPPPPLLSINCTRHIHPQMATNMLTPLQLSESYIDQLIWEWQLHCFIIIMKGGYVGYMGL